LVKVCSKRQVVVAVRAAAAGLADREGKTLAGGEAGDGELQAERDEHALLVVTRAGVD
jgi:hypothetical protein